MRRRMLAAVFTLCLGLAAPLPLLAAPPVAVKAGFMPLTKPGERVKLGAGHYFTYGFDKPAKLGMAIMRIEIFSSDGKRDTGFTVRGDADMPSMRGAHAAGEKPYSLSAKGVYLMPVRLVMPGDWEVSFTIGKNGKNIYRGAYLFDL